MSHWSWKRLNYLTHRWVGIVLGLIMLAWFASGVVMMYYPYPVLTESARDALLEPFQLGASVLPFPSAAAAATDDFRARGSHLASRPDSTISGGRLIWWQGRPAWQILHQRGSYVKPYLLVDALTGKVLSPVDSVTALAVATAGAPPGAPQESAHLLPRGDHYMFWGSYHLEDLPVWRVRFGDPGGTWVYVGQETGRIYARADRLARVATWTGTVPHWLYFMWLYGHPGLWTWLNLLLPGVAVLIALTGMVLGTYQLFPKRHRGSWRVSAYHGVSLWHHLAGIVFGALVFTWTLSGVFEMLGPGNDPRPGQAEAVRGGPLDLDGFVVPPDQALDVAARAAGALPGARFLEATQLLGEPGYRVVLADGSSWWVDGASGQVRGEMAEGQIRLVAEALAPGAEVGEIALLNEYDDYYYQRHGREMHLPVWRVRLGGSGGEAAYLDTLTGEPRGWVDADVRFWRWLRDGMHSLDFPALIRNRPAWDLVVLPLMLGGVASCLTGVWLLMRRVARMGRRR